MQNDEQKDGKPAQSWQQEQGSQRYLQRRNGETEMQKRRTGLLREAGLTTATRKSESMIRTARDLLHKRKLWAFARPGKPAGIEKRISLPLSGLVPGGSLLSCAEAGKEHPHF